MHDPAIADLRDTVNRLVLDAVRDVGLNIEFAEGLFIADVTVSESEDADEFAPLEATIQRFESSARDGTTMKETDRQIVALVSIPGDYVAGTYAVAVKFPTDGNWRVITAGCEATIPDYTPPE